MAAVEYQGGTRFVCGRARYPQPPEPGTIVGPKDTTNEPLVALADDEHGYTLFGYATVPDLIAAHVRIAAGEAPRSLAETRLPALPGTTGGAR